MMQTKIKCQLTTTLIWTNVYNIVTGRHIQFIIVSFVIKCAQCLIIGFECSAHVCSPNSSVTSSAIYNKNIHCPNYYH